MDAASIVNKFQRELDLENGKKYIIKVIPTLKGIKIASQLSKFVLPIIGGTIDGIRNIDPDLGPPRTFSDIAKVLIEKLESGDVEDILINLLQGARVKELDSPVRDLDIDQDFRANYGELIAVLEFSLKENFGSAFSGKGISHRLTEAVTNLMGSTEQE